MPWQQLGSSNGAAALMLRLPTAVPCACSPACLNRTGAHIEHRWNELAVQVRGSWGRMPWVCHAYVRMCWYGWMGVAQGRPWLHHLVLRHLCLVFTDGKATVLRAVISRCLLSNIVACSHAVLACSQSMLWQVTVPDDKFHVFTKDKVGWGTHGVVVQGRPQGGYRRCKRLPVGGSCASAAVAMQPFFLNGHSLSARSPFPNRGPALYYRCCICPLLALANSCSALLTVLTDAAVS